ncbi:MAG: hypothetical protein NC826_04045 [Candidatus Omnitrophica bacterium]|nr:hypothetical protein [Candidatus Omnitrophota bacterium]
MKTKDIIFGFFIIFIGLYLFAVNTFHLRNLIFDDAFYEFRYARNIKNGFGVKWNPSEVATEGYSNFLAVLFYSLFFYLKCEPVFISHLINIICVLMISIILYVLCKEDLIDRLVALTITAIYISTPSSAKHAMTGLNTSLFIFTVLLFFYTAIKAKNESSFKWLFVFLPATYLLLILARLEGIFFASLFLLLLLYHSEKSKRKFFLSCIICYTIGLIYFAWKYFYFGSIFSNPFWIKVDIELLPGKVELILFILRYATLFIFALFGFIVSKEKLSSRYSLFFIILICSVYLFNRHIMGFDSRFFIPAIPFLLFLTAQTLDRLLSLITRRYRYLFLITILLFINPSNFNIRQGDYEFIGFKRLMFNRQKTYEYLLGEYGMRNNIQIANLLSNLKSISKIKILSEDSGAIGYYSDAIVIDLLGHTHSYIARIKDNIQRLRYVLSFYSPDLIIFRTGIDDYDCRYCNILEQEYLFLGHILDQLHPTAFYYLNFWIKKKSEYFKELSDALNGIVNGYDRMNPYFLKVLHLELQAKLKTKRLINKFNKMRSLKVLTFENELIISVC